MKIWLLSSDSSTASLKRLVESFHKSQCETEIFDPLELHFEFGRNRTTCFHKGQELELPDLALLRLGWQSLSYGLRVGRFLESAGCRVLNSPSSVSLASDKLSSLQLFHSAELPVPQTAFAHRTLKSEWHLLPDHQQHVLKTLRGSQGFGVTWQTERQQAMAQVDAYRTVRAAFLAQELVAESAGRDVRAFVVGGEIVAAMERTGTPGDLRSNLHQGGKATRVELSAEEKRIALKACESLGLFYSGVDFLRTSKGPLLLEANPSPGFDGISQVCEVDVAGKFSQAILKSKHNRG